MNSERWRCLEEVYHQVVLCPPERRAAVLEESCSSDPELRQEIESLLAARENAGTFLSEDDLPAHLAQLASEAPAAAAGARLGDYEVLSALGAGAMGEVYRARDTRLGREVALKILPRNVTYGAGLGPVSRFQAEARAASALNHPNTVTIYEIGQASGTWFIAAELIDGVTVRERMREGPLPVAEAVEITAQCAAALQAAHDAGIVHRDIKPENLMIRRDGVVKVVDFGLARILEPRPEWAVEATQTGSVMGTPRYMSPEQARGQKPDARSDIFSLGAVLYEMVAGRPAFPGGTAPEIFAALLGSEPDFSAAGPLAPVIAGALAKDPAARYQTMKEFRAALRDSAPFMARVATASRPERPLAWRRMGLAVAAISTALAIGGYVWTSRRGPGDEPLQVMPVATFAGPKAFPAISPDGNRVAFSWQAPGANTRHIYIKTTGEGEPVRLTSSNFDDEQAVWSPDGRQIAFSRRTKGYQAEVAQEVYVVGVNGGGERKVGETWRGVSWSPDGKTLALTRVPSETGTPAGQSGGVFLLALNTGQTRDLTVSQRDSYPEFSPDGQWVAFKRQVSGSAAQFFVVRAAGGQPRQITFDPLQPIRGAAWTPDSREVVVASLRSGADGSLWRVPVAGGPPRPFSATLRDASDPTISPQGRMAYREEWIDSNIYLLTAGDVRGPAPASFGDPTPVVISSREDHSPAFSPDGERIAFVSERSGNLEIWLARRDGSQPVRLTSLRAQNTGTPRWSPDGRRIAFDSWATGKSEIYVVDASGGEARVLTSGRLGSWMPDWSPDGQWIYFSRGVSSATDIWKIPAGGGEAVQITHAGGFQAHPSPDGRLLYYSKANPEGARSIWLVPVEGGAERPVPELEPFRRILRCWGVTRRGIYFLSHEPSPRQTVRFFSFQTRRVTALFPLEKQMEWGVGALALSPDGRYALGTQLDHSVNDLMMIVNFR